MSSPCIDSVIWKMDEGGDVKIIRLSDVGVEFHWDKSGDEILDEIASQLPNDKSAYLNKMGYGWWAVISENKTWNLIFNMKDMKIHESLEAMQYVVKTIYDYPKEKWQKAWTQDYTEKR